MIIWTMMINFAEFVFRIVLQTPVDGKSCDLTSLTKLSWIFICAIFPFISFYLNFIAYGYILVSLIICFLKRNKLRFWFFVSIFIRLGRLEAVYQVILWCFTPVLFTSEVEFVMFHKMHQSWFLKLTHQLARSSTFTRFHAAILYQRFFTLFVSELLPNIYSGICCLKCLFNIIRTIFVFYKTFPSDWPSLQTTQQTF